MSMNYLLKEQGFAATNRKLAELLRELSWIDVENLTTFELRLLRAFAVNPPTITQGAEKTILDHKRANQS